MRLEATRNRKPRPKPGLVRYVSGPTALLALAGLLVLLTGVWSGVLVLLAALTALLVLLSRSLLSRVWLTQTAETLRGCGRWRIPASLQRAPRDRGFRHRPK